MDGSDSAPDDGSAKGGRRFAGLRRGRTAILVEIGAAAAFAGAGTPPGGMASGILMFASGVTFLTTFAWSVVVCSGNRLPALAIGIAALVGGIACSFADALSRL